MNVRRFVPPLLMAFTISGVCTLALSRKIGVQSAHPVATVLYMAPTRALSAGEVLRADNLKTITWPAEHPVVGAFLKPGDLLGRAVLYPVETDQPLTEKLVSALGAGIGLSGRIPDGMRAISLQSDEVVGVAGFLLPGSHLDVLVTYRTDKAPDPRTMTVLQNAEVLAAGHQVQPDPQGKPATVDVVTLLLSPGDAERAVMASTQGKIHFVLRSGSDRTRTADTGILLSQLPDAPATRSGSLLPSSALAQARKRPLPPPGPAQQSEVQTISGDKQVTTIFNEVRR